MSAIRVRFAPSPTGYLHVGGARTALFNLLFARHQGGTFVLRIEDTDRERSSEAHVRGILDGMQWLGLTWDEGPHFQSAGVEQHRANALRLVAEGQAYRDFSTPEDLDALATDDAQAPATDDARAPATDNNAPRFAPPQRRDRDLSPAESDRRAAAGETFCVRFKIPPGVTAFHDLIHGPTTYQNAEVEDFVLLRADLSPTYHLSVVSDDIAMRITHVVRGDDHLSNTPKQICLYNALGATPPMFGHLPLILGPDKKRLSKRHGATSVLAYRDLGILPEAMVNFLALLGWNPGDDREIMTLDELAAAFSWDGCGKSGAVFDYEKLLWMNGRHLERAAAAPLVPDVEARLARRGAWPPPAGSEIDRSRLGELVALLKVRARSLEELADAAARYLATDIAYDAEAVDKHLADAQAGERLAALLGELTSAPDWSPAALEAVTRAVAERLGVGAGKLIHPARVALLGVANSPGLFEVMALLGRRTTLTRLDRLIQRLGDGSVAPAARKP